MEHYIDYYDSPLGRITLGSDGNALIGLWIEGQKYYCEKFPKEAAKKDLEVFSETKKWLDTYFSGKNPEVIPKLKLQGSDFRHEVWEILKRIPFGKTTTYGQIAKEIASNRGLPGMSCQAVGGAVGHNPISIIIPCHRVLGQNGNLTGYAGGVDLKIKLLQIEGIDTSEFFYRKKLLNLP